MRTQIFLASTLYGAATLAAAVDSGHFTDGTDATDATNPTVPAPADRRLLLVSNNAASPETSPALDAMPGFERLRDRFDAVLSWNDAIWPHHPGGWSPRAVDVPMWERYLRMLWGLGDEEHEEIELTVESIQVDPAQALARIFPDAPIDVYADGLMSYGPTRNKLDPLIGTRVRRLLHLDLVPGLEPLLLTEFDVPAATVPSDTFRSVLADLSEELPPSAVDVPEGAALLLGQYLSALDILSPDEEEQLHARMLRGAAALGHRTVVFKPHPSAPERFSRTLEAEAGELGVELTVLRSPVLAEALYRRTPPALVVGCFSTALMTASTLYGLPTARCGTETLLERLAPYQNSNRVPVTLIDALLPDISQLSHSPDGAALADSVSAGADGAAELVRAVGFCMRAEIYPRLRAETERYLARSSGAHVRRYFKRRRLTALTLPGGVPRQFAFVRRNPTVRRVAKRARAVKQATVG